MIKFIVKKYALSVVNKTLTKYDAKTVALKIGTWLARANIIVAILKKAAACCEDNQIDDAELKSLSEEFEKVVKSW